MSSNEENNDSNKQNTGDSGSEQQPPPTIVSWIIRGISLLLVVGLLGYFTWSAFAERVKPEIEFTILDAQIEQRGGSWAVPVDVKNTGTMSVHNLTVRAEIPGGGEKESEMANILLMGPGEVVRTTFWFRDNPRLKGVECSAASYLLP